MSTKIDIITDNGYKPQLILLAFPSNVAQGVTLFIEPRDMNTGVAPRSLNCLAFVQAPTGASNN